MRKVLVLTAAMAFLTTGCKETAENTASQNGAPAPASQEKVETKVTDRDGNVYESVRIGDQVWMSENLKVETKDSWCYGDDPENCNRYGRLYTWDAAMNACPKDWSLPNNEDWETLKRHAESVAGTGLAGKALKDGGTIGFNALLGGDKAATKFQFMDETGYFWSATEDDVSHAYDWIFSAKSDDLVAGNIKYSLKRTGLSVRCIKKEQGSSDAATNDIYVDKRNNKRYKVVRIGSQRWLAENLAYKTTKSHCLDDEAKKCEKYGQLYTWVDAMQISDRYIKNKFRSKDRIQGICPEGWHLPSYDEWDVLLKNVERKVPKEKVWASLLDKKEAFVSYFMPRFIGDGSTDVSPEEYFNVKGSGNVNIKNEDYGYYRYSRTFGTNMFGFNALVLGSVFDGDGEDDGGKSFTAFWTSTDDSLDYNDYRNYVGNTDIIPSVDGPDGHAGFKEVTMLPVRCVEDD